MLGYEVCDATYHEILAEIKKDIEAKAKASVISFNPNKVILAKKNSEINEVLLKAKYLIPDGTGILLASRRSEQVLKNRITGISLFEEICANCSEIGGNIFLYGASAEVVEQARIALMDKYQGLIISGCLDGYTEFDDELLKQINESGANILAVAMGSPKQELWIKEHSKRLENICIFIGVGGAFDIVSGRIKRAPSWIINLGLEWAYRIVCQPISRFKNIITLVKFCKVVLSEKK